MFERTITRRLESRVKRARCAFSNWQPFRKHSVESAVHFHYSWHGGHPTRQRRAALLELSAAASELLYVGSCMALIDGLSWGWFASELGNRSYHVRHAPSWNHRASAMQGSSLLAISYWLYSEPGQSAFLSLSRFTGRRRDPAARR